MNQGMLFIVSAPSGAGKTSLVAALIKKLGDVAVSVSFTTRAMREGEVDGFNYHFVDEGEFQRRIDEGDFLEHARVFDNLYGTSRSAIEDQLAQGKDVILEIDWQGAQQVRELMPDTRSIFVLPPSREVLEQRLNQRGQDSQDIIERRMRDAQREMSHYSEYDYVIVNDDFETALDELRSVFMAERQATKRQIHRNSRLISALIED